MFVFFLGATIRTHEARGATEKRKRVGGVPNLLPRYGVLFLLVASTRSPDRFAATAQGGRGTLGSEGCARRNHARNQRATYGAERGVHSAARSRAYTQNCARSNDWPGGTSARTRAAHHPLCDTSAFLVPRGGKAISVGGVKGRMCVRGSGAVLVCVTRKCLSASCVL